MIKSVLRHSLTLVIIVPLVACSTFAPLIEMLPDIPDQTVAEGTRNNETIPSLLDYFQLLQRMSSAELQRERSALATQEPTPGKQVGLAMLLGLPRINDLGRAQSLLDSVLRSTEPEAVRLHPLARVMVANFQERQRLQAQNEKLVAQLKNSQQLTDELQEKLDALADIERSIPIRPTTTPPTPKSQR